MRNIHKSSRAHKGSGSLPKWFFIFFVIIGFIVNGILKEYKVNQYIVILIPVSLIVTYCIVAKSFSLFHLREDQIGDNAYYLGFLYTLSSLSYALLKFSLNNNEDFLENIISSFGVSLFSTIAGIALRVFFSQMRQDPNDIEEDARTRIAQTASNLSIELNQAAHSFYTFRLNLQQSLQESFTETSKVVNETLTAGVKEFSETAQGMVTQIATAFSEFNDHGKKLNDASAKTVRALEKLNDKIEKIEAPENIISDQVKSIFSEIEGSSKKLATLTTKQTSSIENLVNNSEALTQSIRSLNEEIGTLRDRSSVVDINIKYLDSFPEKIRVLSDSINNFSEGLNILTQNISGHTNVLEKQFEKSKEYTDLTHQSLSSMVNTLSKKLG